jgi:peptide/nickel transport system substrate-binding protein
VVVVSSSAHHMGRIDFAVTKVVGDIEALKGMDNMKMTPLDIPYTRMIWINQYDK